MSRSGRRRRDGARKFLPQLWEVQESPTTLREGVAQRRAEIGGRIWATKQERDLEGSIHAKPHTKCNAYASDVG